jgi:hypothetical protein
MATLESAQVQYLRDVLGIDRILLPLAHGEDVVPESPESGVIVRGDLENARLIVAWCREEASGPEADELARKMIAAMKVENDRVAWIEWGNVSDDQPREIVDGLSAASERVLLAFGPETANALLGHDPATGEWQALLTGARLMATYSPEDLLASPERKKQAWAHLQIVMKAIAL